MAWSAEMTAVTVAVAAATNTLIRHVCQARVSVPQTVSTSNVVTMVVAVLVVLVSNIPIQHV